MKKHLTISIPPSYDGRALIKYLKNELAFSSAKVSSIKFDPDGLLLNGERVTVRAVLREGDVLRVLLSDSENREKHLIPNEMPLEILYEDDSLIALNKPAGTVCHPSKGHLVDSLASGLRAYLDRTDPEDRIHLIGRLDKETSGIVLCAKNAVAAALLERNGGIQKTYTALASGHFPEGEGTISLSMHFYRDEEGILRVAEGGEGPENIPADLSDGAPADTKTAQTSYTVLSQKEDFAVLSVTITTGRMHQIRFHLAALQHPLLGDRLYGGATDRMSRAALHAGALCFTHPFTKEEIRLEAPLPADMARVISEISQK